MEYIIVTPNRVRKCDCKMHDKLNNNYNLNVIYLKKIVYVY